MENKDEKYNFDNVYSEMSKNYSSLEKVMSSLSNEGNIPLLYDLGNVAIKTLSIQVSFVNSYCYDEKYKNYLIDRLEEKLFSLNQSLFKDINKENTK